MTSPNQAVWPPAQAVAPHSLPYREILTRAEVLFDTQKPYDEFAPQLTIVEGGVGSLVVARFFTKEPYDKLVIARRDPDSAIVVECHENSPFLACANGCFEIQVSADVCEVRLAARSDFRWVRAEDLDFPDLLTQVRLRLDSLNASDHVESDAFSPFAFSFDTWRQAFEAHTFGEPVLLAIQKTEVDRWKQGRSFWPQQAAEPGTPA